MSAKDFIKVRKAIPGEYSDKKESFSLSETEDKNILNLKANTDFKFYDMKKGDSIPIKKDVIESELNNYLFGFQRKDS